MYSDTKEGINRLILTNVFILFYLFFHHENIFSKKSCYCLFTKSGCQLAAIMAHFYNFYFRKL